ncbi:DUF2218 domain-containing protein [Vreelandella salicampi]|uniref:DUF2218 domain-containing protein n=1 Tax=Vreelandella salicampi TaxID=1449798 RepID=A0A7Z0LK65_9GAMM|nr:DUF2218 domain-containing protein [Halomonas salicampi]NYS60403.1 DUF2218 domain-containing protein [Halomonas salicampi]
MSLSRAEIATPSGEHLIDRLCKHWAPEFEVEHSAQEARIAFASGTCLMRADEETLAVAIETLEEEHLDTLEGVVERQLMQVAGDEALVIIWEN